MAANKIGKRTFRPERSAYITNWASIAGKKEKEGPLGHLFDFASEDTHFGAQTWEQAEKNMQQLALQTLIQKAKLQKSDIDLVFSGDLLNQCIGSSFTLRNTGLPHLGLYGACSTMAESLLLASMTVGGGYADRVIAMTSSHFASSERQYRFPLGYGGQRTPTAQWTVTGSGAALVTSAESPIQITSATVGTVTDLGITDANNMGAAMAPAAVILRPCPKTFQAAIFLTHTILRDFLTFYSKMKSTAFRSFSALARSERLFPMPEKADPPSVFRRKQGAFGASGDAYEPNHGLFLRPAGQPVFLLSNP